MDRTPQDDRDPGPLDPARLRAEARAASHRLELLLEVSEQLAGSLHPAEVEDTLGRLLVPSYADHLLVDVVQGDGVARRRIIASGEAAAIAARLEATAAPWPPDGTPAAAVLAGSGPLLIADVPPELVATTSGDAERRALAQAMAPRSGIAVPLVGRSRVLGALSMALTDASGRRYAEEDLGFAVEVGRRAGLVIEAALLYQAAQEAARHIANLQALTSALASAHTVDEVARLAVTSAGMALGGGTSSLCLLSDDGSELELVAERGYHPETAATWRRFPATAPVPAVDAMRTGRPVVLGSLADRDARYPVLTGTSTADRSLAVIPLVTGDNGALGALTVGFADERTLTADDEALLLAITGQCTQAVQRARLRQAERAAADHKAFLADAADALNASLDVGHTLDELTALAVPRLSDSAVVHLVTDDALALRALRHVDPEAAAALRALHTRATGDDLDQLVHTVATTGRAVLLPEVDLGRPAPADDRVPVREKLALRSFLVVPLKLKSRVVGVVALGRGQERPPFSAADLGLVEDLASRAAVALDNALSHEARIRFADALQASLLPPALPEPGGIDLSVRYRSVGAGVIGGDFYDVFTVDGGRSWLVVIGDVCGKGPEAAAVTSLVRHTIRAAARADPSPAALLRMCNDAILDADLGERFATIQIAAVRPQDGQAELRLACGGHPPPVIRRADGAIEEVQVRGDLVGLFEGAGWEETASRLGAGDDMVLFTDGLLEARSPSGAFAPQLLDQVLRATAGATADQTTSALLAAIDAFEAGQPRDDLAVLVVHLPGTAAEAVQVHIPGAPAALLIAADEHLDELIREIELIRVGRRRGVSGTAYPQRLLTVLDDVLARQAGVRELVRDQAELAVMLGEDTFTCQLVLPPVAAVVIRQLAGVLDDLERHACDGELLTMAPPPVVAEARRAFFAAAVEQLERPAPRRAVLPLPPAPVAGVQLGTSPADLADARRAGATIALSDTMAREARRDLLAMLEAWGAGDLGERFELPLSELVTNVQIHARSEAEVVVLADDTTCRVEVHDGSPTLPSRRTHDRVAGTGRGLQLVSAYVDRWGAFTTARGKCVWMELDLAASAG